VSHLPRWVKGRARGQAIGLAAVAMVAVVGALAFVVDAGFFFEGRRELQNAADSAALAGVVFLPDCPDSSPGGKCTTANALDTATTYVSINGPIARQLCGHPSVSVAPGTTTTPGTYTGYRNDSFYYTLTVSLTCNPGFSFGRILVGLLQEQIAASATAVVGSLGSISCAAPLDVVAFPTGTVDNNFGYLPGLDYQSLDPASPSYVPIDLETAVQTYVGSTPGGCDHCGSFLEVCLTPGNCGGPAIQSWFAGNVCIGLDSDVGQNLTGSPGGTIGPVVSGLGDRGFATNANNANCRDLLSTVVNVGPPLGTGDWSVKTGAASSPCLIQVAILNYADAASSSGRSTFGIDGFATIFVLGLDGSSKEFHGVFVKSEHTGKVITYRDNGTHVTRLIR
jgi:hypothetical protein